MANYSFEQIKSLLNTTIKQGVEAELVDNIVLSRDWDSIDEFYCLDFS